MIGSINSFDLNLLRVFDALYEERSVGRAAQRLALTQSAVSHALARLRHALEDDLFVRTGAGMRPTERAFALASPIREVLVRIEAAIGPEPFDPAKAEHRFVVAANDLITLLLLPSVLAIIGSCAPRIDIVVRPGTRLDLAEQIDLGRIDIAIGSFSHVPARLKAKTLFDDDDVLFTCRHHPLVGEAITAARLGVTPLIVVSLGGAEEGAVQGFIFERGLARRSEMFDRPALETALETVDQSPRLAVVVPHFLAVPGLLSNAPYAAILPRALAKQMSAAGEFVIHELPYASSAMEVQMVWHERTEEDAARRWLRQMLMQAAAQAGARRGPAPPPRADSSDR